MVKKLKKPKKPKKKDMAAVVVTNQNIRLADAESTNHYNDIGGGQGGGLETDFFYQNANCYARKGGTSARGIFHLNTSAISSSSVANPTVITCAVNHELTDQETVLISGDTTSTPTINGTHTATVTGATTFTIPINVTVGGTDGTAFRQTDLTAAGQTTVMFKAICTTPGLLDPKASDGWQLGIGSDASNYYLFDVHGNDTYPIRSSWLIVPVDANVSAYRDETVGTPVLTTGNFFGLEYDQSGTSKSPNQGLDAVDVGTGLTLVGGDGGDTDGVWADLIAHDEGTVNNRFGYVTSFEGVIYIFGQMLIGSATATVFNDSNKTIVFPDGLFAQGFSGITLDLQSATTDIDFANTVILGKGSATTEETRPQLLVTGTSGDFLADTCTFDAFDTLILTSACTLTDCLISGSNSVDAGSGADLGGTSILVPTVAANTSGLIWDVNLDPDGELDNMTFSKGSNAHHAIEFGVNIPTSSITLRGCAFGTVFSGTEDGSTGDETFHFLDTTGTITLNLVGCTGNFGYRTEGVVVTIVADPVTYTGTILDNDLNAESGVRVRVEAADNSGPLPFQESVTITQSAGTATVAHTAHGMANGDLVVIRGANEAGYNLLTTIANQSTNAYEITVNSGLASPATGTIVATGALIDADTDGSGQVSITRTYSAAQPIIGTARKSTSTPFFKPGLISGTISNTLGLVTTTVLVLDE